MQISTADHNDEPFDINLILSAQRGLLNVKKMLVHKYNFVD